MPRFSTILSSVLVMLAAAPAAAQNASTAGALELYPTFEAVGARLTYSGDTDGDATARLEWRPTGGTWTNGVAMTRITNNRWAGSVMWLQPGTSYEVRAVIDDPDGGSSASGQVTTRSELPAVPTGRTWWVATNGSDTNDGSSGAPLATFQEAANRAGAGEEIRVRAGIYYQTLDATRSGSASAPIHLVADGPGVVLDGSDPAYLNRSDWQNDGGGVYSVPFSGSTRLVSADASQRLYHHSSLSALQSSAYGINQGWAISGGRLYVKLEDGSSPNGHVIHVARYNTGMMLQGSYWRVVGFEVRHFGTTSGGAGIRIRAATGCVVADNTIHTLGGRNIFLNALASNNLMERNVCTDPRIDTWPWDAVKAHEEELTAISNRGGRGNVIRFNVVSGLFNGIDCRDGGSDEDVAADCDMHDNTVDRIGDDAFEIDVVSGINVRAWRNRMDDCFVGFSIAPIYQGPTYVLYNDVVDFRRSGFKFSLTSVGEAWICHNTVAAERSPSAAVHPTGPYSKMRFRNNILTGRDRACVNDDAGEAQSGNDFDYDLIDSNYGALFRWKGTNYASISALRSGTGFETGGRSGNPQFVSPASGDYTLQASSPAVDGGMVLPGINDGFLGSAPDMGAHESGATGPDLTPPAAINDLSASN